jgi:hypothetical protein
VFRLLSGFLFLSGPYAVSAEYAIDLNMGKLKGDVALLNKQSHTAMFAASTFGQNSPLAAELNSEAALIAAYDFCTVGTQSCTIISFASYDLVPTNWAVSEQYTLVTNGACSNTITPTAETW